MFQVNFELLACWCMESGEQKVSDNRKPDKDRKER